MASAELDSAIAELNRTVGLPVYEAFDVAWVAVLKIANLLPGAEERDRLRALLDRIPDDSIRSILHSQEVDTLLNLDPPLETILSYRHERLQANKTAQELELVRLHRDDDPKLAVVSHGY